MELRDSGQVPLFLYKGFEQIDFVRHAFSSRMGGVSEGIYSSMNFKEDGADTNENIRENYRRIANALGCDVKKMVRSQLSHGVRVHEVTEEDYGVGVLAKSTLLDYDGLITDKQGVTLVATFADCVPLYFIDEAHKAIGLAHSGWRGTVDRIALHMLEAMEKSYGTKRDQVLVAIGPCICGECYEVGAELKDAFSKDFSGIIEEKTGISFEREICRKVHKNNGQDKYLLDLRKANLMTFLNAGVPREHILISEICSCCNPDLIFSHRFTKGQRGVSAAFLGIK
jgi:YfiH family protein